MTTNIGVGAIVEGNDSTHWPRIDDFLTMLDICTDELGITYIDSARDYRLCEETLGGWLQKKGARFRQMISIGTKVMFDFRSTPPPTYTKDYILTCCDESLRKLQTDYVDIYWLHAPHPTENNWSVIFEAFDTIVRSGKARQLGVSNIYNINDLRAIRNVCAQANLTHPVFLQNECHLIYFHHLKQLMQDAKDLGLSAFAFSPLASGVLSGKYQWSATDPEKHLPEGSRWHAWKKRFPPQFWTQRVFAAIDQLKHMAQDLGHTPVSLSLAWSFCNPLLQTTLIGPRRPEHLTDVKRAITKGLAATDALTLEKIFTKALPELDLSAL